MDFDYLRYFDELKSHGLNHTRTFTGVYREDSAAFRITDNTLAPKPNRYVCPWARSDKPSYEDGGNKFDLTKWDVAYFARLRDFMTQAQNRGIVVELTLFCPMYNDGMWQISPMNAANNVNGIGKCARTEVYTLKHRELLDMQLDVTRKIVRELREFDYLYYEVCNEPYFGGVTMDWQHKIVDAIVETERNFRAKHLISMKTEHKAVTDVFEMLAKEGFEVSWVEPDASGLLNPHAFAAALRDDTQLASIMFVNNETGVIQDVEALGTICRERDILFHVDGAQAVGKLPVDLGVLPVDLLSLTGHKFYGPKGIGALYIADRPGCHVEPILFGGGQQRRIRPGTLPTDLIAGLGMAADVASGRMESDLRHLRERRRELWDGIRDIEGITLNGDPDGFPGILNVSVEDVEGESLLLALEPVCVATGSACNSKNQEPSYVLRAIGRSDAQAQSAIRFSVGRATTTEEVLFAANRYRNAVARLRDLAPEVAA